MENTPTVAHARCAALGVTYPQRVKNTVAKRLAQFSVELMGRAVLAKVAHRSFGSLTGRVVRVILASKPFGPRAVVVAVMIANVNATSVEVLECLPLWIDSIWVLLTADRRMDSNYVNFDVAFFK